MKLSKIGSKNTYHKCIKELHEAKYIYYQPSPSKFLPVRISLIRLDMPAEQPTRYKQLDLFGTSENESQNSKSGFPTETSPPQKGFPIGKERSSLGGGRCPNIDTDGVPNLTVTGTDFDTVPVPKMGHNIKPNFKENKTVSNTPTKNFYKNGKNQSQQTGQPGVPNLGLGCHPEQSEGSHQPEAAEVQVFFISANYPITEAQKFFLYNKGRGWILRDKVPIKDWQALAHKWMLGIGKNKEGKKKSEETGPDAGELFKLFSNGQKIFNLITVDHFQQLQLELTEAVMQEAWQERISQLTGSNQNSILQLLQAYMSGNQNNELIVKDKQNLISLAKRMAVLKHFKQQKE